MWFPVEIQRVLKKNNDASFLRDVRTKYRSAYTIRCDRPPMVIGMDGRPTTIAEEAFHATSPPGKVMICGYIMSVDLELTAIQESTSES